MLGELPEAYAALAAGRAPELPPLQASYVDFAFWQRARLEDDGALAPQARSRHPLPYSGTLAAPGRHMFLASQLVLCNCQRVCVCPGAQRERQGCLDMRVR